MTSKLFSPQLSPSSGLKLFIQMPSSSKLIFLSSLKFKISEIKQSIIHIPTLFLLLYLSWHHHPSSYLRHFFSKYLLNDFYVPGTILGT